ncbi:unnamed protein product [Gongylonema pulchrum]|uniref:Integrase n=1 Tax=Gongylonema pulchrum TaxID=637853 RepID=A0A183EHQ8_9BILA|nr:unnamed protein product [Gongylonema pulchrum]
MIGFQPDLSRITNPRLISSDVLQQLLLTSCNFNFAEKDWTWKEIAEKVKYTNKPIGHSLLRLDNNEADKLAQEAFICEYIMLLKPLRTRITLVPEINYKILLLVKNK